MKFLYTRREVEEAVHNAIVAKEREQYMEERYHRMEKEISKLKDELAALDTRLFNDEMAMRRHECNCRKPDPTATANEALNDG